MKTQEQESKGRIRLDRVPSRAKLVPVRVPWRSEVPRPTAIPASVMANVQPVQTYQPEAIERPVLPWRLPPWPPIVPPEIVADAVPMCSDCGLVRVVPGQPGKPTGQCFRCWVDT